jgi:hypothetical protein
MQLVRLVIGLLKKPFFAKGEPLLAMTLTLSFLLYAGSVTRDLYRTFIAVPTPPPAIANAAMGPPILPEPQPRLVRATLVFRSRAGRKPHRRHAAHGLIAADTVVRYGAEQSKVALR